MNKPSYVAYKLNNHTHLIIFDGARSENELLSVISKGISSAGPRTASDDTPLGYDPLEYDSMMRRTILNYFGYHSMEEMAKGLAKRMPK